MPLSGWLEFDMSSIFQPAAAKFNCSEILFSDGNDSWSISWARNSFQVPEDNK